MNQEATVLFVCEHGSAKSTVAAAHFNKLAREQGLNLRGISRGTKPDQDVAPLAQQGLAADGLAASATKPQKLSTADLTGAVFIVTFSELPAGFNQLVPVERWDDIPPMGEDYGRSRDVMVERIKRLLANLKSSQ